MPRAYDERMAEMIDTDVLCLNCGYNLRMQTVDGECPECGLAVNITLRKDRLADAPLAYRQRLQRGATWWWVGTLLACPLLYGGVLIATLGLWNLTRRQPDRHEPMPDQMMRHTGRNCLAVGMAGMIAIIGTLLYAISDDHTKLFHSWQQLDGMFILVHAIYVAGLILTCRYLATLAQRAEQPVLARHFKRLEIDWLVAVGIVLLVGVIAGGENWAYAQWSFDPWWLGPMLAGVLALTLVWLWVQIWRTALRLRQGLKTLTD